MGAIDTAVSDSADGAVDGELVRTIEAVEEGDFLVLNGDSRTWEVTDVVDRSIEDSADDRLSKRVLRLTSTSATFGLELVEYPDCYQATIHVLATNGRYEASEDYIGDSFEGFDRIRRDLREMPEPLRPLLVGNTLVRFTNGMV